jgi:UDP-N-acetylglucosamine 1-carboxyvinyltransferase
MGADITVFAKCLGELICRYNGKGYKHSCIIKGPTPLKGIPLEINDIRAGCAHIIAALTAQGTSEISGIEHLDRGYQDFENKIKNLGAQVKRV